MQGRASDWPHDHGVQRQVLFDARTGVIAAPGLFPTRWGQAFLVRVDARDVLVVTAGAAIHSVAYTARILRVQLDHPRLPVLFAEGDGAVACAALADGDDPQDGALLQALSLALAWVLVQCAWVEDSRIRVAVDGHVCDVAVRLASPLPTLAWLGELRSDAPPLPPPQDLVASIQSLAHAHAASAWLIVELAAPDVAAIDAVRSRLQVTALRRTGHARWELAVIGGRDALVRQGLEAVAYLGGVPCRLTFVRVFEGEPDRTLYCDPGYDLPPLRAGGVVVWVEPYPEDDWRESQRYPGVTVMLPPNG